jgi:hypothetical protein
MKKILPIIIIALLAMASCHRGEWQIDERKSYEGGRQKHVSLNIVCFFSLTVQISNKIRIFAANNM